MLHLIQCWFRPVLVLFYTWPFNTKFKLLSHQLFSTVGSIHIIISCPNSLSKITLISQRRHFPSCFANFDRGLLWCSDQDCFVPSVLDMSCICSVVSRFTCVSVAISHLPFVHNNQRNFSQPQLHRSKGCKKQTTKEAKGGKIKGLKICSN